MRLILIFSVCFCGASCATAPRPIQARRAAASPQAPPAGDPSQRVQAAAPASPNDAFDREVLTPAR